VFGGGGVCSGGARDATGCSGGLNRQKYGKIRPKLHIKGRKMGQNGPEMAEIANFTEMN
jgi:hypothetical protein